jgi:hypothetical protein
MRIEDVVQINANKNRIRKEIYTRIYEQFSSKIKQSGTFGRKEIIMTIPSFVMGYPMFDRGLATRYIMRQFTLGGFTVHMIGEYDVYVSWDIPKKKREPTVVEPEPDLPNLMNLKKMANKYRSA